MTYKNLRRLINLPENLNPIIRRGEVWFFEEDILALFRMKRKDMYDNFYLDELERDLFFTKGKIITIVNISGLIGYAFHSQTEIARNFHNKFCNNVLAALLKTGEYND